MVVGEEEETGGKCGDGKKMVSALVDPGRRVRKVPAAVCLVGRGQLAVAVPFGSSGQTVALLSAARTAKLSNMQ